MLTIFETNFQTAIKYVLKIQKKCIFPAFRAIVKWGEEEEGRVVFCFSLELSHVLNRK